MSDRPRIPPDVGGWMSHLPLPILGAIGVVILVGVGAGGYYAYRTYDYVQHDNHFCMSCHLMAAPFEQFAESAHRGLGCKACHQPTLMERSTMALTQVVESPEALTIHAEVPNERCAECHIRGDPVKWRLIAQSVGHRVHLQSDDPKLQGLQCVECHSTSVHQFAPLDRTCGQSGCHEENLVQLGGMSQLTIHCAACHNFVAPVREEQAQLAGRRALDRVILPDSEECLSCHAMRALVQMPNPDPHGGVCASCHNPHTQSTPQDAVQSCATAECHSRPDTLTGFHRGLQPGALENCTNCHRAHDFRAMGDDCVRCHQGVLNDDFMLAPGIQLPDSGGTAGAVGASIGPDVTGVTGVGAGWWAHAPAQAQPPRFRHSQHRNVTCTSCHAASGAEHGQLRVRTLEDCRQCHHTEPMARNCARCHDEGDMPRGVYGAVRAVSFSTGSSGQRTLSFRHEPHADVACGSCHTGASTARSAASTDCASCHVDHHDPDNECSACHARPPVSAHPPARAHVTCSGSGCHTNVPFETVPRTRQACLGCHQTMTNHRPGRACIECHALPEPRGR